MYSHALQGKTQREHGHEIDVLASHTLLHEHITEHIFVECKFHNAQGTQTDAKTALYVYAQFLDVTEKLFEHQHKIQCFSTSSGLCPIRALQVMLLHTLCVEAKHFFILLLALRRSARSKSILFCSMELFYAPMYQHISRCSKILSHAGRTSSYELKLKKSCASLLHWYMICF